MYLKDKFSFRDPFLMEVMGQNVFPHYYLDGVELVDARPEVVRVSSECDFQQRQEPVHPR